MHNKVGISGNTYVLPSIESDNVKSSSKLDHSSNNLNGINTANDKLRGLSWLAQQCCINRNVDPKDTNINVMRQKIEKILEIHSPNLDDLYKLSFELCKAIIDQKTIFILGDYDVDGLSSTSMFGYLFQNFDVKIKSVLHSRSSGYGHQYENIKSIISDHQSAQNMTSSGAVADDYIVLMLDSGSQINDTFAEISDKLLIVDHHKVTNLPDALAFVNPHKAYKCMGDNYESPDTDKTFDKFDKKLYCESQKLFQGLCTTGLAFVVIHNTIQMLKDALSFTQNIPDVPSNHQHENIHQHRRFIHEIGNSLHNNKHVALNIQKFSSFDLLSLVALGVYGDVMDVAHPLNRLFVNYGLHLLNNTENKYNQGIKLLFNKLEKAINEDNIAWYICPCINAAGRVGDVYDALKVLFIFNGNNLDTYVSKLIEHNHTRRKKQKDCQECAQALLKSDRAFQKNTFNSNDTSIMDIDSENVAIVYGETLDPGVVGIVANTLCEAVDKNKFKQSVSFVLYKQKVEDETGRVILKGSGRSRGVDLAKVIHISKLENLLRDGGGHNVAAGVEIYEDKLNDWRRFIVSNLSSCAIESKLRMIDVAVDSLSTLQYDNIDPVGPFGEGNDNPIAIVNGCKLSQMVESYTSAGKKFLKLTFMESTAHERVFCLFNDVEFWKQNLEQNKIYDLLIEIKSGKYKFALIDIVHR